MQCFIADYRSLFTPGNGSSCSIMTPLCLHDRLTGESGSIECISRRYDSTMAALIVKDMVIKGTEQALCEHAQAPSFRKHRCTKLVAHIRTAWRLQSSSGLWSPNDVARHRVPGDSHVRIVVYAA